MVCGLLMVLRQIIYFVDYLIKNYKTISVAVYENLEEIKRDKNLTSNLKVIFLNLKKY